jgi:hypothetical protein
MGVLAENIQDAGEGEGYTSAEMMASCMLSMALDVNW